MKLKNRAHALVGPHTPSVETIGDLREALATILPECYRRVLHTDALTRRVDSFRQAMNQGTDAPGAGSDYIAYLKNITLRTQNMRLEGIRRLLHADRLRLTASDVQIPVASLNVDEQIAVTAILLKNALKQFQWLTQSYQPTYLSDWNQLALGGGIDTDDKGITQYPLFLSAPNRDEPSKMHTTNGLVAREQ